MLMNGYNTSQNVVREKSDQETELKGELSQVGEFPGQGGSEMTLERQMMISLVPMGGWKKYSRRRKHHVQKHKGRHCGHLWNAGVVLLWVDTRRRL